MTGESTFRFRENVVEQRAFGIIRQLLSSILGDTGDDLNGEAQAALKGGIGDDAPASGERAFEVAAGHLDLLADRYLLAFLKDHHGEDAVRIAGAQEQRSGEEGRGRGG